MVPTALVVPAFLGLALILAALGIFLRRTTNKRDLLLKEYGQENVSDGTETGSQQFLVTCDELEEKPAVSVCLEKNTRLKFTLWPIVTTSPVFLPLPFLLNELCRTTDRGDPKPGPGTAENSVPATAIAAATEARARFTGFRRHLYLLYAFAGLSVFLLWIYLLLYFDLATFQASADSEEIQYGRYFAFGIICAVIDLLAIWQIYGTHTAAQIAAALVFGLVFAVLLTLAALTTASRAVLFLFPALGCVIFRFWWIRHLTLTTRDKFLVYLLYPPLWLTSHGGGGGAAVQDDDELRNTENTVGKPLVAHAIFQAAVQVLYLVIFVLGDAMIQVLPCVPQQVLETLCEMLYLALAAYFVWCLATEIDLRVCDALLNAQKVLGCYTVYYLLTQKPTTEEDLDAASRTAIDNAARFFVFAGQKVPARPSPAPQQQTRPSAPKRAAPRPASSSTPATTIARPLLAPPPVK